MKAIRYRITLLEPTLVASFGGAPDSVEAFDYLPGSVLRGILIGKYLRKNGGRELNITDSETRSLFFDGSTRFLNGYPLDRLNKRMLPTPHSWRKNKGDESTIFDFAVERDENDYKSISDPFCSLSDENARLHQSERLLTVHTTRTRRFGRAMNTTKHKLQDDDKPDAIYRYDALASNQVFEAVILCDRDEDTGLLKSFIEGDIFLGKSRSSGYGRAKIECCDIDEKWQEASYDDGHDTFIVTLLSDTLLRDQNGSYTTDVHVLGQLVSNRLGVELRLRDAFVKSHVVGGFNRKWGLPLPQALALQAGSVLVFETDEAPDSEKLAMLLWQGIGERRAEGFGRIGVNWHTSKCLTVDRITASEQAKSVDIKQRASREIAQRMLERLLKHKLDSALTERANDLGSKITKPNKSQLSRLRAQVQNALRQPPKEGREVLLKYLDSVKDRKSTRDQFTRDRVAGKQLLDWLIERIKDEQAIWKDIGFEQDNFPKLGEVAIPLTSELAYEYNLRFVDAVLARAAKHKRGEL